MRSTQLLVGLGLLVANGFFVAVEFALLASRRTKLEAMADGGSTSARLAVGSMRRLNLQLAGAQLGVTMAPGATLTTRIPLGANSRAAVSISSFMPPLLAQ